MGLYNVVVYQTVHIIEFLFYLLLFIIWQVYTLHTDLGLLHFF
nr:MAG TPA: hypothetical protein [Caudoviricetes sp.]